LPDLDRQAVSRKETAMTKTYSKDYRNHGTHAEAIEILFDPTATSYRKVLEFFF